MTAEEDVDLQKQPVVAYGMDSFGRGRAPELDTAASWTPTCRSWS